MSILMLDPIADVETVVRKQEHALSDLANKKVGFVFNQHVTSLAFWKRFESEIGSRLEPSSVHALHKVNTWAPAPEAELDKIAAEADYVLVGVGA